MIGEPDAGYADPVVIPVLLTIAVPAQPERSGMSRLRTSAIPTANGWPDLQPGATPPSGIPRQNQ